MTDDQQLHLVSVLGPAVLCLAVFLISRWVPDRSRSAWRVMATGLVMSGVGFCMAVNLSAGWGDAIAYVGVICVICGMIANPRGDK